METDATPLDDGSMIYLELHPETAQHVAGAEAKHGRASDNLSFAATTAAVTGAAVRTEIQPCGADSAPYHCRMAKRAKVNEVGEADEVIIYDHVTRALRNGLVTVKLAGYGIPVTA